MGFSVPQKASYCTIKLTTDQANPSAGDTIAFDTEEQAGGDLSKSTNDITGFKAGKVYLVIAKVALTYTAAAYAELELYDTTAAAVVGPAWMVRTPTLTSHAEDGGMLVWPFVPASDTSLRVRVKAITANADIDSRASGTNSLTLFSAIEIGQAP